jgi:hypothetical protein
MYILHLPMYMFSHLILLDMIIPIKFGEEFMLWGFPLCSFPQPPVRSKYSPQHPVLKHIGPTFISRTGNLF